jgi:hypothetical protein
MYMLFMNCGEHFTAYCNKPSLHAISHAFFTIDVLHDVLKDRFGFVHSKLYTSKELDDAVNAFWGKI